MKSSMELPRFPISLNNQSICNFVSSSWLDHIIGHHTLQDSPDSVIHSEDSLLFASLPDTFISLLILHVQVYAISVHVVVVKLTLIAVACRRNTSAVPIEVVVLEVAFIGASRSKDFESSAISVSCVCCFTSVLIAWAFLSKEVGLERLRSLVFNCRLQFCVLLHVEVNRSQNLVDSSNLLILKLIDYISVVFLAKFGVDIN